jgi:prepilin-type N-terminal cleavage/methylation domain-containing protein
MKRPENIQKSKLNNGGFSLIELIVVMAVVVVLAGAFINSMSMLNGRRARACREELLSKLDGVRTTTMGKRTATATVEKDGTGYVLKVSTTVDGSSYETKEYKLASSKVTLYYSTDPAGGDRKEINPSLTIEFDRASGALKPQAKDPADPTAADTYVRYIYAVQNGKEYGIRLYPETGKIQREE